MSVEIVTLLVQLSPLLFIATAIASYFQPGKKPAAVILIGKIVTVSSILIAALGCFYVYKYDLLESKLIGFANLGLSLRLDSVSAIMLIMISLLSFIIIKFSVNYLDGDPKHGAFIGRLSATIASVQFFVLSGNLGLLFLAWVLTSISLHRLLVFYPERPAAKGAARKKFLLARLADVCLLVAIILLYNQFGTGNLESIFNQIKGASGDFSLVGIGTPAFLLAIAALLKSAQFPTHGWLIEVMETPTPVSSLLHAGLLNAGPYLIIRMAFIMHETSGASVLLMIIGGLTALFASIAYLTQTSVKTALAYSSIGHMGFSLMLCGLGVYSAALLHLVAHSFYKAHSFLSSGSGIDVIKASKTKKVSKSVNGIKTIFGIIIGLSLYIFFAYLWGIDPNKEFSLFIIGGVIALGLSRIFTSALQRNSGIKLFIQASIIAMMVIIAFFTLESGTHHLILSQIPDLSMPQTGKIIAAIVLLALFALAVIIQIIAPKISPKAYQALAIHFKNGLYFNAIFDRMIGASKILPAQKGLKHFSAHKNKVEKSELRELKEQIA